MLQRKVTQHVTPDRLRFVPDMDFTKAWSDADLYEFFELSVDEIAYIESTIQPRSVILSLESPVPASHLPGGSNYGRPLETDDDSEDGDDE